MSYNIDAIEYISGKLFMNAATRDQIATTLKTPECCFFEYADECFVGDELIKPWWSGEGSGLYEEDLYKALSHTTGSADLLLTWEGGDSHSGIRVVNGKVTQHELVFALGEECK